MIISFFEDRRFAPRIYDKSKHKSVLKSYKLSLRKLNNLYISRRAAEVAEGFTWCNIPLEKAEVPTALRRAYRMALCDLLSVARYEPKPLWTRKRHLFCPPKILCELCGSA